MGEIYMIFNANGGQLPRIRYEGLEAAREEAKRLARVTKSGNFYILKVVEAIRMRSNPFDITVF